MNSWRSRIFLTLIYLSAMLSHSKLAGDLPNTPEWQGVYHGSAAFSDFFLLMCSTKILRGKLSEDMQDLCVISMTINAVGWFAYLAWISKTSYNFLIDGLSCIQFFRLLFLDAINAHYPNWHHIFFRSNTGCQDLHSQKAKR